MGTADWKGIIISSIIGVIINLLSGYLFYLQKINFTALIFIVISSIIIILIIGIQLKTSDIGERMNNWESENKRLVEKLKIYKQLIDIKVDLRELQREVFKK